MMLDYKDMTLPRLLCEVILMGLLIGTLIGTFLIGIIVSVNTLFTLNMNNLVIIIVTWIGSVLGMFIISLLMAANEKGWIDWTI